MAPNSDQMVLHFAIGDGHSTEVDFGDVANVTHSSGGQDDEHPYYFAGGPIGPKGLNIVLAAGWYRHDYATLRKNYHPAYNTHLHLKGDDAKSAFPVLEVAAAPDEAWRHQPNFAGLDNGNDDEAEEEPEA